MTSTDLLTRDVYGVTEAARLVGRPHSTISMWLHGTTKRGKWYPPVLRDPDDHQHELVRWGEFVSIAFLDHLRDNGAKASAIRRYMERMTSEHGREFPLARRDVYVNGAELAWLTEGGYVEDTKGHVFSGPALVEAFINRVEWEDNLARGMVVNPRFPDVRVDPLVVFGAPQIGGRRTSAVADYVRAGHTLDEIVEWHRISRGDAIEAMKFEAWLHDEDLSVAA